MVSINKNNFNTPNYNHLKQYSPKFGSSANNNLPVNHIKELMSVVGNYENRNTPQKLHAVQNSIDELVQIQLKNQVNIKEIGDLFSRLNNMHSKSTNSASAMIHQKLFDIITSGSFSKFKEVKILGSNEKLNQFITNFPAKKRFPDAVSTFKRFIKSLLK